MSVWRVSVKPYEDLNAWEMCKEQGIIVIGWPDDNSSDKPQLQRFERIAPGDVVVAHVPESHGGSPGLICGIGVVTKGCYEMRKDELPAGDSWTGNIRRQCDVNWLSFQEHDMRQEFNNDWRGTVHKLTPERVESILRVYGLGRD